MIVFFISLACQSFAFDIQTYIFKGDVKANSIKYTSWSFLIHICECFYLENQLQIRRATVPIDG